MEDLDIYFVKGEGSEDVIFRQVNRGAQIWEPVTGKIHDAQTLALPDGRTKVHVDLPENGSVFVVFGSDGTSSSTLAPGPSKEIIGPWEVSFKYMDGVSAVEPSARTWSSLHDLTEDEDNSVKFFSGDVTYSCDVELADSVHCLKLSEVLGGLAHVYVNGLDCGVAWTAPWTVDISKAACQGMNRIVIVYTGTWTNRLIGDCFSSKENRVARTNVRVGKGTRVMKRHPTNPYSLPWPTVYSRYLDSDPLMPSGVTGVVKIW